MEIVFALAVLAAFSVLTAIAYSVRGHSALVGLIVGFLFGPFGLFYALFKRRTGAAVVREARAEGRVPCPHCAEFILPAAKICPYCRSPIEYPPRSIAGRDGQASCPYCLFQIPVAATACPNCGRPLEPGWAV